MMPNENASGSGLFRIVVLDEIDSTNLEALRRAAGGERGPLWIVARRQTAGRGRLGRAWLSDEGNLTATLLLALRCPPARLHQLSFVAGLAVFDALAPLHARAAAPDVNPPRLKWPNDILAGESKLGGILIESTTAGAESIAAIGIGLNIASAPLVAGRPTASLSAWGATPSAQDMTAALGEEMTRWLGVWRDGDGFAEIRAAWLARAHPIGTAMSINLGAEQVSGVFAGMDETGALLVDTVPPILEERRRITYGDVSVLRRTAEGPNLND